MEWLNKLFEKNPQEVLAKPFTEIVLMDGRFATIYNVRVRDAIIAYDDNGQKALLKLIATVVKIDDNSVSIEDVLNLHLKDFQKISNILNGQLNDK